uniref:Uncharacterized protein n=1 Tax=Glossina austeni TaxID=7395 RepID=A0A1A9VB37_GLOAU
MRFRLVVTVCAVTRSVFNATEKWLNAQGSKSKPGLAIRSALVMTHVSYLMQLWNERRKSQEAKPKPGVAIMRSALVMTHVGYLNRKHPHASCEHRRCVVSFELITDALIFKRKRKVPRSCFNPARVPAATQIRMESLSMPLKRKSNEIKKNRSRLANKNGASKQSNTVDTHYCDQQSQSVKLGIAFSVVVSTR